MTSRNDLRAGKGLHRGPEKTVVIEDTGSDEIALDCNPLAACGCLFSLLYWLSFLLIGVSLAIMAAALWSVTYKDENHPHPAIHFARYYHD